MIRDQKSSMRILEHQVLEARRLHEKSVATLESQKIVVAAFLDEGRRKAIMDDAYLLESRGVHVLDKISGAESLEEIESILEKSALSEPKSFSEEGAEIRQVHPEKDHIHSVFSTGLDEDDGMFKVAQGENT